MEVAGIPTRVQTTGTGPPVLVLHGWGAKIEAVQPIVSGLQDVATVHAVDLPGFGETGLPPEPWGVGDYARWTLELMDELGLDRPDVVAHSFGGRIAIHIAANRPERVGRLILVDAAGIRPKRGASYYRRVYTAKAAKHLARLVPPLGRALQRRIHARAASSDYANAGPLRPTFVKVVNEDLTPLLPRIGASSLLIWGSEDTATPVADGHTMERLIPDAGLVVFEGAGHYSYIDEPARFGAVARHFLTGGAAS